MVRFTAVVALTLAAGCAPSRPAGADPDVIRPPARHAVEAARLREMMAKLDDLTQRRLPDVLDASGDLAAVYADLSYVASRLAGTAAHIPDVLSPTSLPEADEKRFRRLAASLRSHAVALEDSARRRDRFRLDGAVSRIDATCDACHTEFRNVAPALERAESRGTSEK